MNLVTAADIKDLTSVGETASDRKLTKAVPMAQLRHLRPLIGAGLLAALLDLASAAPAAPVLPKASAAAVASAAADAYKAQLDAWRTAQAGPVLALWDELRHCLAEWTVVEAWPDLLVHVEEAGVVVKTGNATGTTSADAATLADAREAHRERAIVLGDELVSWVERNKAKYVAYVSASPLATGRQPIDDFGGISL